MAKQKTYKLSKGTKLVSLGDYMMDLIETPEMKQYASDMKKFKDESPAQYERKYSKELMDLCMMINFHESIIAQCTDAIQHSNENLSTEDLDIVWDRRKSETFAVARLYNQYDQLVAKLDLDVHNEQARKRINQVS
jgi:hypothetical protein